MYTIFNRASGWRRFGGSVSEARNQDHDDRDWSAIVDRLCSVAAPHEREPLAMRILHRTAHAAALTIPPVSARADRSSWGRTGRRGPDDQRAQ
jgi:hypothetical protein